MSTFEDRWSMCRPSKIDLRKSMIDVSIIEDRIVDLRTSMVDVKYYAAILAKTLIHVL